MFDLIPHLYIFILQKKPTYVLYVNIFKSKKQLLAWAVISYAEFEMNDSLCAFMHNVHLYQVWASSILLLLCMFYHTIDLWQ